MKRKTLQQLRRLMGKLSPSKEETSLIDLLRSRLPKAPKIPVDFRFTPSRGQYASPEAALEARVRSEVEANRTHNRNRPRHEHRTTSYRKIKKRLLRTSRETPKLRKAA